MTAIVKRVRLPVVLLLAVKKKQLVRRREKIWCGVRKKMVRAKESCATSEGKHLLRWPVEGKYLVCAREKIGRGLIPYPDNI